MKNRPLLTAFLVLSLGLLLSCSSNMKLVKASQQNEYTEQITVEQGKLIGVYNEDGSVQIFAGIPYAKPPLADLRWKEPQNAEKWDDVFIADKFAPMSMQKTNSAFVTWLWNSLVMKNKKGDRSDNAPVSEDCLYLNIWRESNCTENSRLPVLVYIHGGSLVGGNSYSNLFDGEEMAKHGVIRVNIDYRTGIFGFFAHDDLALESANHTTGNYGILDQIKALEWIHNNIAQFGGDPDNITIAGESAGSSCVSALCASPLAKGLFVRAIGESSSIVAKYPPHTFYPLSKARVKSFKVMVALEARSIADMRKIDAKKLVKYTNGFNGITIDGYVLPEYPSEIYKKGKNNEKQLLNGYNFNDGKFFATFMHVNKATYKQTLKMQFPNYEEKIISLYPPKNGKEAKFYYSQIFTANAFAYAHYQWSQSACDNNVKVYEYFFTKENKAIGSNHAGELVYAYGNVPKDSKGYDERDYNLENTMMSYWLNFAKTGNPNGTSVTGEKLPEWKSLNDDRTKIFELGENIGTVNEPFLELYPVFRDFIDTIKPGDNLHWDPREK